MSYPAPGQQFQIKSYKHDKTLHRVWNRSIMLQRGSQSLVVGNDRATVREADGREWITREPAICTFGKDQWFNTIGMLREDGVHYYCNIGSPYKWANGCLEYIDYDLDVKVFPNMTYVILDEHEFKENKQQMNYSERVTEEARRGLEDVLSHIFQRKGPFQADYVEQWYERFLSYR